MRRGLTTLASPALVQTLRHRVDEPLPDSSGSGRSARSGGPGEGYELTLIRRVVWMGLMPVVATLVPVGMSRFGTGHEVLPLCSLLALVLQWGKPYWYVPPTQGGPDRYQPTHTSARAASTIRAAR
jgi:hypothetical protein